MSDKKTIWERARKTVGKVSNNVEKTRDAQIMKSRPQIARNSQTANVHHDPKR